MREKTNRQRFTDLTVEQDRLLADMTQISKKADAEGRDLRPDEGRKYKAKEAKLDAVTSELRSLQAALFDGTEFTRGTALNGDAVSVDGRRTNRQGEHAGGHILAEGIRALTGGAGLGQVMTPAEDAEFVLDHLAAQSVGLLSGFTTITTERDQIDIPHTTSDGGAAWTAEAAVIANVDVAGETITAVPRKLGALQQLTNEVIADSNPSVMSVVFGRLTRAMANKLDLGFYEGSGTPPEIRGLKNVAGIGSVSMGANGLIPANLDPFADALGLLGEQNATGTAIVMHPRTWRTLSKVKEVSGSTKPVLQESAGSGSQGIERRLYGVPVFLSSQVSVTEAQGTSGAVASSAYVYEASRIIAVYRQGVELKLDTSRLFNSDQAEIRAVSRWDVVVPDPEAVVRIAGILA